MNVTRARGRQVGRSPGLMAPGTGRERAFRRPTNPHPTVQREDPPGTDGSKARDCNESGAVSRPLACCNPSLFFFHPIQGRTDRHTA